MKLTNYWTVLVAILVLSGCTGAITVQPLGKVTRIDLKDQGDHTLGTITDSNKIDALVTFINARRNSWTKPFPETPIPAFVIEAYDGDKFVGHFGAGKTFFETQCEDDFCSQKASSTEIQQFLALTGENASVLERP